MKQDDVTSSEGAPSDADLARVIGLAPPGGVDSARGEFVFIEPIDALRELGVATARIRLVAVEDGGDRMLGEYNFNHTPHSQP